MSRALARSVAGAKKKQAEWRLAMGPEWRDEGWVFTMEDGRPVSPDYATSRFSPFLRELFTRRPVCGEGHVTADESDQPDRYVVEGRSDQCDQPAKVTLPSVTLHRLRHGCASLLFAQGCAPRLVMEILGHSQVSLTMNTYTHLLPEADREAADAMQGLFGDD